ncbi:MAG: TolC family protein [Pseudodesulfovibrio sp.]|nr:TolC family protein [Pseudodesulfovibrio sp.]
MKAAFFFGVLSLIFFWCQTSAWAESADIDGVEERIQREIEKSEKEHALGDETESGSLKDIPAGDVGYTGADKIDFLNEQKEPSFITAPSIPLSADKDPLTLQEACRLGILNHPRIETSNANVEEAEADYGIARSQYYPTVDWMSKLGPSRELDTGAVEYGDTAFLVSQKVYKFGGIRDAVASAQLQFQSAQLEHARTREDIAVLVINAYLSVLQAQELVHVYEGTLLFYQKLLQSFQVRYAGGISSLADAQKVEVSLRGAESQLVTQNEQLSTSRSLLENIIDTPISSVEPNVDLLRVSINETIEESYERALDSNLKLQALGKQIAAQNKSVDASSSAYAPVVGYRMQVKNEFQEFRAVNKFTQTAEAQLTLDWNLFNGFATTNEVKKQKAVLRRLKASRRGAELEIRNVLTDSLNSYTTSAEEFKLAKEAFDSSVSLMSLYLSEFDLGIRTMLDLTSAREGQTSAAVREVNARFTRIRAALNIVLEEGRLEGTLKLPLDK